MNNCLTWGNVWSEWKDAMWKWPHCPVCDTWGQTTFKWDAVYWTFTECQLVEEVITALVSGSGALNPAQPQQTVEPWEPWNPYRDEKKKEVD